jgi:hypothetical protein
MTTRTHKICKAISWEASSNLVCFGLAYIFFGDARGCAIFTGACIGIKILMYCYHEQLWGD